MAWFREEAKGRNPLTWRSQHKFENIQKRATMVKRADLENETEIRDHWGLLPSPPPQVHLLSFGIGITVGFPVAWEQAEAGPDFCPCCCFLSAIFLLLIYKPHPHSLLFKPFFPTNHLPFPLDSSAHPTPAEDVGLVIPVIYGSLFLLVNKVYAWPEGTH